MAALTLIKLSVHMLKFSKKFKNLFEEFFFLVKENRESIEIFNFFEMDLQFSVTRIFFKTDYVRKFCIIFCKKFRIILCMVILKQFIKKTTT
jgi:hypothetical protein